LKLNTRIENITNGTNIMNVDVPDVMRKRVKSSLAWVDDLFNGGFIRTTTTLFTGTPGSGKTTLILQLANAATKSGNKVLFNTAEESLYQTKMVVERLRFRHGFICGQDTDMEKLLKHADEIKPMFLFIDSLQTMNDGKYGKNTNSKTPERCLELITNWAKENKTIAIIIGQVGKSGNFKGSMTLKHMVDAHMHLTIDTDSRSETFGFRLLELQKYRFGPGGKTFVLEMRDRGLKEYSSFKF
jgi:DNA repair protein RadA/Sms